VLVIHLLQHEGLPEAKRECRVDHLHDHLSWTPDFAERVVAQAEDQGLVRHRDGRLWLTPGGRALAQEAVVHT